MFIKTKTLHTVLCWYQEKLTLGKNMILYKILAFNLTTKSFKTFVKKY